MTASNNPLAARPPKEVALKDAPLVRVLAQLRFPRITSIVREEFIAPFQEAIREEYPVLRLEQSRATSDRIWRFADDEGEWRASLASGFLALETTNYTSRHDFMERLDRLFHALREHINPKTVDRLGVRYIDRIYGDAFKELNSLVRSEVAGILKTEPEMGIQQSISESVLQLPEEPWTMLARWGKVPAGATTDPNALEPIESESWILDLDVSQQESLTLDVEELIERTRFFAERIYTFFRWAVTEEFLVRYGGKT